MISFTYKKEPTTLVEWARLTQSDSDYAEVVAAQEAQYKLTDGKFDPTWDKWWIRFTIDPDVVVTEEKPTE